MRATFQALCISLFTVTFAVAAPTLDKPAKPAIEQKLHGLWIGEADCQGDITIESDGTFTWHHFGPGNATVAGKWSIKWDALPPTLIMIAKKASDKDYVGKVWDVKVVELNDEVLAYQRPDLKNLTRFKRGKSP